MSHPKSMTRELARERILSKCSMVDGHLVWQGAMSDSSALISLWGQTISAQRTLWELEGGEPLGGMVLRRSCDVEKCITPAHQQRVVTTREKARPLQYYIDRYEGSGGKPYLRATEPAEPDPIERAKVIYHEKEGREGDPMRRQVGNNPPPQKPIPVSVTGGLDTRQPQTEGPQRSDGDAPEPGVRPPYTMIVGPFKSGGIVVFTPWGTFNGELVLREPEKV